MGNTGIMDMHCQDNIIRTASSLEEAKTSCSGDVDCGGFSDGNGTGVLFHLCAAPLNAKHFPGTVLYTKGTYILFNDLSSPLQ